MPLRNERVTHNTILTNDIHRCLRAVAQTRLATVIVRVKENQKKRKLSINVDDFTSSPLPFCRTNLCPDLPESWHENLRRSPPTQVFVYTQVYIRTVGQPNLPRNQADPRQQWEQLSNRSSLLRFVVSPVPPLEFIAALSNGDLQIAVISHSASHLFPVDVGKSYPVRIGRIGCSVARSWR